MSSFTNLFNPTFFMILGILVLAIALLIVYYESKMRSQNHKIASMLSLVSTLAEDMNGVKMGLNQIAIGKNIGDRSTNLTGGNKNLATSTLDAPQSLIDVSDEEESDSEYEEGDETESENGENEKNDIETDDENCDIESNYDNDDNDDNDDEKKNIKVLKLNISEQDEEGGLNTKMELCELEPSLHDFDIEDLEDLEDSSNPPEVTDDYVEEVLNLDYSNNIDGENKFNTQKSEGDLDEETILGDSSLIKHEENIDYKKLQLPKLRSIAIEKGLVNSNDASKLKKNEILKMFGCE
jgi:hypothetical protein